MAVPAKQQSVRETPLTPRSAAKPVVRGELRLRLTAAERDGPQDVIVEFDQAATVADLGRAAAEYVGAGGESGLRSQRVGALAPGLGLFASNLRDGDVVVLGDAAETPSAEPSRGTPVVELAITGGLAAGRRIALGPGVHDLGRDPAADIVVEDPSLSRRHVTIEVAAGATTVTDAESRNGTAIDGCPLAAGEAHPVAATDHVEVGRNLIVLRPWQRDHQQPTGAVNFNRPPRMARPFDPPHIDVPAPPDKPRTPRLPLAASLAPLALGFALFLIMRTPSMLLFGLFSPLMAVSTFLSDRRGGRKEYATKLAAFDRRLDSLQGEIKALAAAELQALREAAPDAAELVARAEHHLPALWERRRADADFLTLRLGTADRPAGSKIELASGGEPEDRARPEAMIAGSSTLAAAPVVTSLPDAVAIGLSGDQSAVNAVGRWLIAQAATLHSPQDVVLAAALSSERASGWSFLRWLPHVRTHASPLDHEQVAVGAERAASLVQAVAAVAGQRRAEQRDRGAGSRPRRAHIVLVLDEAVAPARAVVEDLLAQPEPLDISLIWLGRDRRDLPGGCGTVVELADAPAAMAVGWPAKGRQIAGALPDGISVTVADAIARGLAPVRDAGSAGAAADIPRAVSLLELLDLGDIAPAAVAGRWHARAGNGIEAVIGHRGDGPLKLDLRADGPHALVAGTTGAGKSELLQTLVTALALTHPPQRLSFLFVDYKGGAAFKDCVRLPHAVGMVTDLDVHMTHRALTSLRAELLRREHILEAHGVKDLVELERRRLDAAPASLVIVIDEFAALKSEVPEFVDGVVDIARLGRSLGVHLVLATQRPAGIVTGDIKANTNLRFALRVSDPTESSDVIDDPVAARVARSLPGRGFVRTGHSEVTEFQSAYVGASSAPAIAGPRVVLRPFGHADGSASAAREPRGVDAPTDLERAVEAITVAAEQAGGPLPQPPWLPPLPEILSLDDLGADASAGDCAILPLGVVDDPARQHQYVLRIDLQRDGHLLVYGTSGAGKTTLLRSIAVSLAGRASPDELHLYGLDCSGRGLVAIEALPHCGGVILGDDEERVRRLFTLLRRTIDARSEMFSARGVSSLGEYARVVQDGAAPPRIVVLMDSYAGFTAAFERVDFGAQVDALARIVSDGRAAGVHLVATADRRGAVPSAVASLIPRKLVLRQADADEYGALGLNRRATQGATLPPGRGFDESSLEIQTPIVGDDPSGERVAAAIAAHARALQERYAGSRAPALLSMPSHHASSALPLAGDPARPYLGIDEIDLAPVAVDVSDGHFLVAGPYRSGRTTALATIVESAARAAPGLQLHLLAPRRSTLVEREGWTSIARGHEACAESAAALLRVMEQRSPDEPQAPLFIVIDDAGELAESPAEPELESLARHGRDVNVRVVAACENGAARGYSTWIHELRKDGNGLLLCPDLDLDGDLLGVRLPRRKQRSVTPGRGYLVGGGRVTLVQVARG